MLDTAVDPLQQLLDSGEQLITHNYVVLESVALIRVFQGQTPNCSEYATAIIAM
jgi:hypothetical protein